MESMAAHASMGLAPNTSNIATTPCALAIPTASPIPTPANASTAAGFSIMRSGPRNNRSDNFDPYVFFKPRLSKSSIRLFL